MLRLLVLPQDGFGQSDQRFATEMVSAATSWLTGPTR
jgi:hypothetical protein